MLALPTRQQWRVGLKNKSILYRSSIHHHFQMKAINMKRVFIAIFCFLAFNAFALERPVVKLETGSLQGVIEDNMQIFKNIPYAAAPVGDLRWRPPQPAPSWSGLRDASQFGDACPQQYIKNLSDGLGLPGKEDCLKLNVFSPVKPGKNLPVMVWFHGGGLIVDGARDPQFTPINLIKNGVVVVTVDYRLGSLGFFATKELIEEAKAKGEPVGNYGTMDQITSLQWVKKNIEVFGGDPNNVTIFGQSAGGRSVTWLMVSDAARGLFHKAIAQSAQQSPLRGMTEKRFGLTPEVDVDAKYMASLGVKTLAELRKLPVQKLVLDGSAYYAGEFGGPFIDGQIIKGDPIPLFAAGKQAKVPFMIGTNSFDSDFMLPGEPSLEKFVKSVREDPKKIEKLYADVKDKCILTSFVIQDLMYRASTKLLANSMNGIAPGYAYYYDYLTPNIRGTLPGAPHTYEIPYVFGSLSLVPQAPKKAITGINQCSRIEKDVAEFKKTHTWPKDWFPIVDKNNPQDRAMSEKMSTSWAAFAKTGNPNINGMTNWPVYSLDTDVMRYFSSGAQTITGLLKERVAYQILHLREIYVLERVKDAF